MEAAATDAELVALLRCGAEEAGEPGEGDAEGSSVAEVDPHAVGVEANVHWGCGLASGRIHFMFVQFRVIIAIEYRSAKARTTLSVAKLIRIR